MKNSQKVAVVTGGNRGIGLEICRQLAQKGLLVILTSRDQGSGLAACEELQKEELPVRYHVLDVDHAASIENLALFMEKEFGRCDVLVNNAGIFPDVDDPNQKGGSSIFKVRVETINKAMTTNVYGPFFLSQALVPLMKKNNYGRIVNMSSGLGQLSEMGGGYPAYRFSKTGINALTRMLNAELEGDAPTSNILVKSMCPGWVKTRMGGADAPRSVEEGADTAVWLATLPDKGPRGGFFRDRKSIPW